MSASRRATGRSRRTSTSPSAITSPAIEVLPWFTYDGAVQQLRVTVRTAVSVANAPVPAAVGHATSEFREAGEARRKGAGSLVLPGELADYRHLPFPPIFAAVSATFPRSAPGTSQPAPDPAHLAARERRAVDPVPDHDRTGPAGVSSRRRRARPPTWPCASPRRPWRWSRSRRTPGPGAATCWAWPRPWPRVSRTSAPSPTTGACFSSSGPGRGALSSWPTGCCSGCSPGTRTPRLLFEFQKLVKTDPEASLWARGTSSARRPPPPWRRPGYAEDPRLRGAGHKIANSISQFLRSPLAEKPFVKSGKLLALHPEAHPPSWYSVAMIAAMPNLRRERAGFTERLGHYLAQPAPKKAFVIQVGKRSIKPQHLLLGDPIEADAKGYPKDISARPALHRAAGADGCPGVGAGGDQGARSHCSRIATTPACGDPRTCGR